jgi:predicted TIM-barrel fold metal-dependent hydrolase
MLVDINAYVGHWPFDQLKYNNCKLLLERMDKFGVDISVVSNLNGIFYKNTQPANEELFEEISSEKRFRSRFVPFAVINPIYAGWKIDFETCIGKFKMKGVRLYPQYHDYSITDPACIELVKLAREYGIPVAFNFRMVDSRQRSWMDLAYSGTKNGEWNMKNILPIIREVPDAKYMILNFSSNTVLSEEEMNLLKKTDLLIDTSGKAITNMSDFINRYGKDKFAFGTHAPILDYLSAQLRIESLSENEANHYTKEALRSGNAKKMLKLI